MGNLKYIMFSDGTWLIFGNVLTHKHVAQKNSSLTCKPISAGFIQIYYENGDCKVNCFGDSTNLELKSNPEDSSKIGRFFSIYQ